MRLPIMLLGTALTVSACDSWRELTGQNDNATRLVLYSSQRQLAAQSQPTAVIAAEVVHPGNSVQYCVRLVAELGTFEPMADDQSGVDGGSASPAQRSSVAALPSEGLRRQFMIYRAGTKAGTENIIGELFSPEGTGCAQLTPPPITIAQLSLTISGSAAADDMSAQKADADADHSDGGGLD